MEKVEERMKATEQPLEIRSALGPGQIEPLTFTDRAGGRQRSGDGYPLKAAVLGQAHWMAVGKLTPGLIHEINNTLCVIGNYVQLLMLERERRGWDIMKQLTAMSSSLERAQNLTHRIAAYAREKAQPLSFIQVNEVLEKALTLASVQRRFREIQVHKAFSEHLPKVEAEPRSLMDAFVELLTIDGQTVAQSHAITVSTCSASGWVTVTFSTPDRAWPCSETGLILARQIVEQQAGRLVREAGGESAAGSISVWLRVSAEAIAVQAA